MGALHPIHLVLVLLVVLLLFGPKKLPELARGVGEALKELRNTVHEEAQPGAAAPASTQMPPAATAAVPNETGARS